MDIIRGFKGVIDYYVCRGQPCARKWPSPPKTARNPKVQAQWPAFAYITRQWGNVTPDVQEAYRLSTQGTNLTARDLFVKNYLSHQYLELHGSPSIPADPQADKWYISEISTGHFNNGLCITVLTDVPVFLTMYWTDKKPLTHPLSRTVRGLIVPWFTRFCFVAWRELLQLQAGDTLVHTFTLCGQPQDKFRYFTFRGTTAGLLSPSVAAIFTRQITRPPYPANPSFELFDYPANFPSGWTRFTAGSGWSSWYQDKVNVHDGFFSCRMEAGGYARMTGVRQVFDATPYRRQRVNAKAWGHGYAYSNNAIYLATDGDPPQSDFGTLTAHYVWQKRDATVNVPANAQNLTLECRAYSPGYGPIFTTWDEVTLEC